MTLQTSKTQSKLPKISRFRLIVGVIMGLLYSLALYSFLYLIREVIRIFSVTEDYDLWILTDNEVNFYNLFFAFISVIIAQSFCLTFWLDRPRKIFRKGNYRLTLIVNDQRVLNWYYLAWFSKLALVFGILFGNTFQGGFNVFSFYPDYNYIFILVIIVLFLQTWSTLRLTFKRNSLKWMLISFVIISIVSFGISRINLIDVQAINQVILKKNIRYNYDLELPQTEHYQKLHGRSGSQHIYVVKSKDHGKIDPIILFESDEIEISDLQEIILWSLNYEPDLMVQLHIDKSIQMEFVNQLKEELVKSGIGKMAYAVLPKNPPYDHRYRKDFISRTSVPIWNSNVVDPKVIYNEIQHFNNVIEVKQSTLGLCFINDQPVKIGDIQKTAKHLILNDLDYMIKFHVNDTLNFSEYFKVVSELTGVISGLRNEYSEKTYSKPFDLLTYKEQLEIKEKFPVRIFEWTTNFQKAINDSI